MVLSHSEKSIIVVNPQLSLTKLGAIKIFPLKDSAENRNPSEHETHVFSSWVLSLWGAEIPFHLNTESEILLLGLTHSLCISSLNLTDRKDTIILVLEHYLNKDPAKYI